MAITTLSMVLTVFVLNLHHITDRPVPRWARSLVLVYLARLLCMCQYVPPPPEDDEVTLVRDRQNKNKKHKVMPNSLGKAIGSQIGLLASLNGTLGVATNPANPKRKRDDLLPRTMDRHAPHYRSQYTFGNEEFKDKPDPKRKEEEWAREWRHLAEVVDRLFFWLFLSAIVITTLLLFHPLTKAYFSILGDGGILGEKLT